MSDDVVQSPGATWSGTHVFGATRVHAPATIAEAQELVVASPRIRSLGTRHSFNGLADTDGALLSLLDVPAEPVLEGDAVTVGAGTRYGVLAAWLEERGRALHNLGSLPHISIGGATATGTHGSGNGNGSLSTAVRAVERIAPDGSLWTVRRGGPGFDGSVVALGALGPVTRITLDTQPSFQVRQEVFTDLPWDALLDDFDAVSGAGYSVSIFTDWLGDTAKSLWVKTRMEEGTGPIPAERFGARAAEGEQAGDGDAVDTSDNGNSTLQGGRPGPWAHQLPHFRLDATPSAGDEIQSEFFVPRAAAREALSAVRALGESIAPALLITELRTVAADELWLSGAYRRDTLGIHFTWKNLPAAVHALLPAIQAALEPFEVRPHWGKVYDEQFPTAPRYERMQDFRDLVAARDPQAKFGGPLVDRILGRR